LNGIDFYPNQITGALPTSIIVSDPDSKSMRYDINVDLVQILVIFLIMIIMFIPSYKVEAKTLQDLKNELADLKAKKAATENNKNLTDSQIKSLRVDIDNTQIEIENTKKEIIAATEKISSSEKEIEEKDKETNELLKFLQVSNGENVYLEYLFEADSYTDFIYRYSVVSQLTEYNSNLMESLKKLFLGIMGICLFF
jgi:peptidoglycan hydrolase CwlO-like protein